MASKRSRGKKKDRGLPPGDQTRCPRNSKESHEGFPYRVDFDSLKRELLSKPGGEEALSLYLEELANNLLFPPRRGRKPASWGSDIIIPANISKRGEQEIPFGLRDDLMLLAINSSANPDWPEDCEVIG